MAKHFLGLTGPYNVLYVDIEHLNFSIFILSNEPGMCSLPYLLGSEQKVCINKLSSQISLPSLEGFLNFWVCFISFSNATLSRALLLGKERSCCP